MKKHSLALLLATCMAVPGVALAGGTDPGFYAGGTYSFMSVEDDDFGVDADVGVLFLRGGYQLNQYVALEARIGMGVEDDKIGGINLEVEEMIGAYAKVGLPTQTGFYPYVLLGVTDSELELSGFGQSASDSDTDLSYGVGVDYWFSSQMSASAEYTNFYDDGGTSLTGLSLGVTYKF